MLKISKDQAKDVVADFQVKIETITRYQEATIDQELFDKVYGEAVVTTEEEFRAKIKSGIEESLIGDSEYKFALDAKSALVAKFDDLTFPDAFLKRWVLSSNENLTEEKLEEDYSKMIDDLKWHLITSKLSKVNNIQVEPADVEGYAKKEFFEKNGFVEIPKENIPEHKIWADCIKCKHFPICNEISLIKTI